MSILLTDGNFIKKTPHRTGAMRRQGSCGLLAEGMVHLAIAAGQDLAVLVGAALVGDGAAGLAGALAGALALAAAAVGQGLTQAGLGDGLDMLHDGYPSNVNFIMHRSLYSMPRRFSRFLWGKKEIHSVRPPCLGFSVYHIVAFEH